VTAAVTVQRNHPHIIAVRLSSPQSAARVDGNTTGAAPCDSDSVTSTEAVPLHDSLLCVVCSIVVVLEYKLYVYNFTDLKLLTQVRANCECASAAVRCHSALVCC
jgi:hypothetical protein